ncbi:hypothetical protein PYW07_017539 [Mythimna separata]|uniref:Uncharacterized protein n=1 Tax=Mythimna separata TaxID=271217 RepID=A0AAD7Y5P1_MYTSE|nr:hypothetical protein PYW07_017539 [Mythimna separata]
MARSPTDEEKSAFTRVLKGQIMMGSALFPKGVKVTNCRVLLCVCDITRTRHMARSPTDEEKSAFTRVLKGQIMMGSALFPKGVKVTNCRVLLCVCDITRTRHMARSPTDEEKSAFTRVLKGQIMMGSALFPKGVKVTNCRVLLCVCDITRTRHMARSPTDEEKSAFTRVLKGQIMMGSALFPKGVKVTNCRVLLCVCDITRTRHMARSPTDEEKSAFTRVLKGQIMMGSALFPKGVKVTNCRVLLCVCDITRTRHMARSPTDEEKSAFTRVLKGQIMMGSALFPKGVKVTNCRVLLCVCDITRTRHMARSPTDEEKSAFTRVLKGQIMMGSALFPKGVKVTNCRVLLCVCDITRTRHMARSPTDEEKSAFTRVLKGQIMMGSALFPKGVKVTNCRVLLCVCDITRTRHMARSPTDEEKSAFTRVLKGQIMMGSALFPKGVKVTNCRVLLCVCDITRTRHMARSPTDEEKSAFTRVLKGQIMMGSALFPKGVKVTNCRVLLCVCDITRTRHMARSPTDEEKSAFTRVLKGQIMMGSALFPKGVKVTNCRVLLCVCDITRTRHMARSPTDEEKSAFTRVLKGQIMMGSALFPKGVKVTNCRVLLCVCDITRTRHMARSPTDEEKSAFTRVLKGQIMMGSALFPKGVKVTNCRVLLCVCDITRTRHMARSPTDEEKSAFTRVLKGQIMMGSALFPKGVKVTNCRVLCECGV